MFALWATRCRAKFVEVSSWRFRRNGGQNVGLIYFYSTLYSQSDRLVPYVLLILHGNHTQISLTFWHSFDFDKVLWVLESFSYVIHYFGVSIRVRTTVSMSHRLQQWVVTFHRLSHFTFAGFYKQFSNGGFSHFLTACGVPTGQLPTYLQMFRKNRINWPMTNVQLMNNFITCISFAIVKQFCYTFQSPSEQVLVANSSSSIVEISYP